MTVLFLFFEHNQMSMGDGKRLILSSDTFIWASNYFVVVGIFCFVSFRGAVQLSLLVCMYCYLMSI